MWATLAVSRPVGRYRPARFSWDPSLSWERFVEEDAGPLLGGAEPARRFIAIAEEIDAHQQLPQDRLAELRREAFSTAGEFSDEPGRRWLTLAEQIARREYMGA